jgi:hypothetical protein
MKQTQDNKPKRKEAIKKTTVRTKTRKLIKKFREKKQQKKFLSHKNIRKSTRRRKRHYLVFSISLSYSFLQLLDL